MEGHLVRTGSLGLECLRATLAITVGELNLGVLEVPRRQGIPQLLPLRIVCLFHQWPLQYNTQSAIWCPYCTPVPDNRSSMPTMAYLQSPCFTWSPGTPRLWCPYPGTSPCPVRTPLGQQILQKIRRATRGILYPC